MSSPWIAYNELAWTESWLSEPADYEDEVGYYVQQILTRCDPPAKTLLHLGSGAGGHDTVFKRHFTVTGVDLSAGMLARARMTHPEIEYIEGDMRQIRLGRQFDAIAIPDSIDYLTSVAELYSTFATIMYHLRPGGVVLLVGKTRETFQNNNFVYCGDRDDTQITLFENNYITPQIPDRYEATLIYLIRHQGELTTHIDRHQLGLFSQKIWTRLFADHGLILHQSCLEDVYDAWVTDDGAYPMQVFVGQRPLNDETADSSSGKRRNLSE